MNKVVSFEAVHTGDFIKGKQAIGVALLNIDIKQNKFIISL